MRTIDPQVRSCQDVTAVKRFTVALIILAVALAAPLVQAQDSQDFFMEKLWDTHAGFDAPQTGTLDSVVTEADFDTNTYDFDLRMYEGLTLGRNFQRRAIEDETLPLARAIEETTTSKFMWKPFATTSMNFTSTRTQTQDLLENDLNAVETETYGLTQMFGGGPSASKMGFTREETVKMHGGEQTVDQVVEEYFLESGLADGWDLSMKLTDTEKELREYDQQDFTSKLVYPLSGGEGHAALHTTSTTRSGTEYDGQVVDLKAPFAFEGGQALVTHHREFADTGKTRFNRKTQITAPLDFLGHEGSFEHLVTANLTNKGKETERRLTEITTPLRFWGTKCRLQHTIDKQMKNSSWNKQRKWVLNAPFKLEGKTFGHEQTFIRRDKEGRKTESLISELELPIASKQATVRRHVDTHPATEEHPEWKREQLLFRTPEFRVGDMMSVSAIQTRTQSKSGHTEKDTTLDMGVRPLEELTFNAKWNFEEQETGEGERQRRVDTALAITDDTELTYHFKQDDDIDRRATVQRHLLLKRQKSDVSLQAGYVSFGVQGEPVKPAARVDLGLGDEKGLRLDANYKEYDPKKMRTFEEEPFINLVLSHSPSEGKKVRLKYHDQKGRVDPERGVDFSFDALGSTWRLGLIRNPILSGEKHVTEADVYDATISRSIFGSLNLEASLLYYNYSEGLYDENVDQHYRFTLDGGEVDRGGNLALSFASGELIRNPKKRTVRSPLSVLDFQYSRRWGDNGELRLVLTRETSDEGDLEDGHVSGRLEYGVSFW